MPLPVRHIISLSGGKDSSALAIYMRGRLESVEYVFCDTGEELPETYEYLNKLEAFLGKKIIRLLPDKSFDDYLRHIYRGVLPDARTRWCTRMLKIRPFERYVGSDPVINYIGIRADEDREGYVSHRPNLQAKYPFIEDGITKEDVNSILIESGLGYPEYYKWRSRSGCYFCFFQRRIEWIGLFQHHRKLYDKAMAYEKVDPVTGERFCWCERESLAEMMEEDRMEAIIEEFQSRPERICSKPTTMWDSIDDGYDQACLICSL